MRPFLCQCVSQCLPSLRHVVMKIGIMIDPPAKASLQEERGFTYLSRDTSPEGRALLHIEGWTAGPCESEHGAGHRPRAHSPSCHDNGVTDITLISILDQSSFNLLKRYGCMRMQCWRQPGRVEMKIKYENKPCGSLGRSSRQTRLTIELKAPRRKLSRETDRVGSLYI
ncbi:uncharacterized protein BO72DRAFT_2320 [Aspergillus fijiensis CBS 313.89]|uniref:Uncharacterized protein n=1 Tax=Aspergillus fijiensis CBS 313.89 TaxID=1448319 RepID=A0A8G1W2Z5_9EURO|nr:uncharacterized protein BO72DRAFT_2320 [Aspergillus fijiensis CBS 313.89]RAK82590.1 hypothetical protein BO72DRAFT_2320 [Aspergillus fijiensis CBS 313.89]